MSFLNPLFLIALAAVAIPVVIHLLNLKKPKRIRFSTLAFFEELQKSTIRKIKIKKNILLILRILAVACLALVLARPFLPPIFGFGNNSNQTAIIALMVDNSISMGRVGSKGPLLEQSKKIAQEIIAMADDDDRFFVQTTNGEQQNLSAYGKTQAERMINGIQIEKSGGYAVKRIKELQKLVEEAPFQNKKLFIISDGQIGDRMEFESAVDDIPATMAATYIKLEDVPVQNTVVEAVNSNTTMIGIGTPVALQVKVANYGKTKATNQFVSLEIENHIIGQYQIDLEADESQTFSFSVLPDEIGSLNGKITIEGDDFTPDNDYYFTLEIPDRRRILLIRDAKTTNQDFSFTKTVLDAPEKSEAQLVYNSLTVNDLDNVVWQDYDAVIFESVEQIPEYIFDGVQDFVQNGKGVLLFPSQNADIVNYNRFLQLFNAGKIENIVGEYGSKKNIAGGTQLLIDHPVFNGLFERQEDEQLLFEEPEVYFYYKLSAPSIGSGLNLITLNSNDPLVREKQFGSGKIIVSAIGNAPEWSNFPIKSLFAPFYYRTILYTAASQRGGLQQHTLGNPFIWEGDLNAQETEILADGASIKVQPKNIGGKIRLEYPAEYWQPGWVEIGDGDQSYHIAANLPISESKFETFGREELLKIVSPFNLVDAGNLNEKQLTDSIGSSGFGTEVWHWFMLAGMVLLITESLVSTFYKAETIV